MEFNAQSISAVVGFLLSFLVESVPGFKDLWNEFKYKELAVVVSGLLVTAAMVGLSYGGAPIMGVPKPFIWDGLWASLTAFIAYLVTTQSAYVLQADTLKRKQQ